MSSMHAVLITFVVVGIFFFFQVVNTSMLYVENIFEICLFFFFFQVVNTSNVRCKAHFLNLLLC